VNDLSLVVSDSTHPSNGIVNLVLSIPETMFQIVLSVFALPGVLVKGVLRTVLGIKRNPVDNNVNGSKGKTKGTKSPVKKRGPGGRLE
jgi:hypothetical protein